jgi:hypothetical protein
LQAWQLGERMESSKLKAAKLKSGEWKGQGSRR